MELEGDLPLQDHDEGIIGGLDLVTAPIAPPGDASTRIDADPSRKRQPPRRDSLCCS